MPLNDILPIYHISHHYIFYIYFLYVLIMRNNENYLAYHVYGKKDHIDIRDDFEEPYLFKSV